MKYMIGYKLQQSSDFINYIIDNKDSVYEVYFSWGDFPNGRNNQLRSDDFLPWEAQATQIADLECLSKNGIHLNLLLNGNKRFDSVSARQMYKHLNFLPNTQSGYAPCLCGKKCEIACYNHLKGCGKL